jgi:hypothetical protein
MSSHLLRDNVGSPVYDTGCGSVAVQVKQQSTVWSINNDSRQQLTDWPRACSTLALASITEVMS